MKTLSKLTLLSAAASLVMVATPNLAEAGRGGSTSRIKNAIAGGSVHAIIAELERAERLVCGACIEPVMALLDDSRYRVREVAAWWFARRAAHKTELTQRSFGYLVGSDSIMVRNAADILGTFRHPVAVPALTTALARTDISAEARAHIAKALGTIGHRDANPALTSAMSSSDVQVRLEAVRAWLEIRRQANAAPVVALVNDSDMQVRRKAAAVIGSLRDASGRTALETQLANDTDPVVRRNAAWALGRIGSEASRTVLQNAVNDVSGLVRRTAKQALRKLR